MDAACLRAWGHPNDPAIRQELLSALEWDSADHPEHARPVIRELFIQVHDRSYDLAIRIRTASTDGSDGVAHLIAHGVQGLRLSLTSLIQVLEARRSETRPD
ncbi:hypothetical protein SAMN02745126_00005 [Enhydrobacter aerosaccus]|uniref:Uncharacterized protein n=1 Tax=Enhydrobacter aerosaccus TaxID=225324 RepID=A0A1T4JJS3_9HYPH|nr:hypothetical protein [Enhydrobacter aerosaccus]SJZ30373.1 hypothetical protein SAMN02745126_00005 [Enhydrobacter aerosaccus]